MKEIGEQQFFKCLETGVQGLYKILKTPFAESVSVPAKGVCSGELDCYLGNLI